MQTVSIITTATRVPKVIDFHGMKTVPENVRISWFYSIAVLYDSYD